MSRAELGGLYSRALRDAPPQLVAQIGAAYARLYGFDAPDKREITHRVVPQHTTDWIDAAESPRLTEGASHNTIDASDDAQPLLPQGVQADSPGLHNVSYRTLPHSETDPPRSPNAEVIDIIESVTQNSTENGGDDK